MKSVLLTCLMLLPVSALALNITPATMPQVTGSQTSQAQINAAIAPIIGAATLLYKQDVGAATDTGPLAGSYQTTFANTSTDPADATITYVGGDTVGPTAWLLVKDGNNNPAWYLFNLTALGWNGTDTLSLTGFWPGRGAISHVTLYGTRQVPEPGSLALLGVGLLGLAFMHRRKSVA